MIVWGKATPLGVCEMMGWRRRRRRMMQAQSRMNRLESCCYCHGERQSEVASQFRKVIMRVVTDGYDSGWKQ
jgi:hypothetical protein